MVRVQSGIKSQEPRVNSCCEVALWGGAKQWHVMRSRQALVGKIRGQTAFNVLLYSSLEVSNLTSMLLPSRCFILIAKPAARLEPHALSERDQGLYWLDLFVAFQLA